jgi:AraC-like DNA-binding protein
VGEDHPPVPSFPRLVCGHFEFDEDLHHPLLSQLPPALMVRWDEEVRGSPLEGAFRYIVREVQDGEPGHEAVVARLSETLFVQVIRSWARRADHRGGVLAALGDAGLGAALAAMHEQPSAPWTLEGLSRRAAMARTTFTERFRAVVGETPLRYLTYWRIQNAKRLLAESRLCIDQVATRVGYESAASFSRVFRRTAGINPGAYRKSALARRDYIPRTTSTS